MPLRRLFTKYLVRPEDLSPSREDMEVIGVFNPGVALVGRTVVILARVAERPRERREGQTGLPRYDVEAGQVVVDWVRNEELNELDPRVAEYRRSGIKRLTFVSHLRVLTSDDGRTWNGGLGAAMVPETEYEEYGVEDPRITPIGDRYYFTYVAVSRHGACTALASTVDFRTFHRHGILFPPENKDVLLFPWRVHGDYMALHRPNPSTHFAPPEMWIARSPDLMNWGHHRVFLSGGSGWQAGRIGGGTPPIHFEGGWLEIYHGNETHPDRPGVGMYSAGALLLDLNEPERILAHSDGPIMVPEADFEREGFLNEIVFPTGIVETDETLLVYYGAADSYVGVTEFARRDLAAALKRL